MTYSNEQVQAFLDSIEAGNEKPDQIPDDGPAFKHVALMAQIASGGNLLLYGAMMAGFGVGLAKFVAQTEKSEVAA